MTPSEIREYVIEVNPSSALLASGHMLELEIKAMNPNERKSKTYGGKVANMNNIPTGVSVCYKIYRDKKHLSYLLLPVMKEPPAENWVQPVEDYEVKG